MAVTKNQAFFEELLSPSAAKWSAGVAFDRSNGLPLDQWSVFQTKAKATEYLTNAKAYPGQVIAYAEDNGEMTVCVLSQNVAGDALTLKQVGIIPAGDGKTVEVSAAGAISLLGAASAQNGTLPMIDEQTGKLVWRTLEDIGAGDGNDNTTYDFAFANQKITITPKFNGQPIMEDGEQVIYELDLSSFVTADELAEAIAEIPENTNTEYHLEYNSDKKEIQLVVGKNDDKMTIDATPFIKDGMLHDVDYDADKKELVFQWNTDAGITEDRVPVDGLVDVYTAGNGLDLTDNKFSIKLDASGESFLTVGENGLKLAGVQAAIDAAKKAAIDDAASKYYGKSEVYTKSEADAKIDEKIASVTGGESAADVKLALESYRDAVNAEIWGEVAGEWTTSKTVDGKVVVTYTPAYGTESRIDKLEKVGAQANVIEEIKVNGNKIEPANKSVNIAVPTDVKDLADVDKKYITNVRMRAADEENGYTPVLSATKSEGVVVIDDEALQTTINGIKSTADTAVQSATFAGVDLTKNGTKVSISKEAAVEALGLKSLAFQESIDTGVHSVSLASGTNNGTVKLTVDGVATDNIQVKGLGSAAYANTDAFDVAGAAANVLGKETDVAGAATVHGAINKAKEVLGGINDGASAMTVHGVHAAVKALEEGTVSGNASAIAILNDGVDKAGSVAHTAKAAADAAVADLVNNGQVKANAQAIGTLIGTVEGDNTKSVRAIAGEEVAKIVDGAPEAMNTLKEVADWIANDQTGAAAMAASIDKNRQSIEAIYTPANGEIQASGILVDEIARIESEINSINDASTGILAQAKEYADQKINNIPVASINELGLVKLSEEVGLDDNKALEIKSVNANKLVQDEGDWLVLNGGTATL